MKVKEFIAKHKTAIVAATTAVVAAAAGAVVATVVANKKAESEVPEVELIEDSASAE